MVAGASLSAPLAAPGGWAALKAIEPGKLDPRVRQRLAEAWARDALFEHASVASFSRFSLHLMAVAAPPELLDGAHKAAIDEIHHARLCFALASAYAGEPLGPGPLPLTGDVLGALDLPSIAIAAVKEGCIGETLASLDASTAQELAQLDAPREALAVITEDEARHAELAWRFVKWALDEGDAETRRAIERAFIEALVAPHPAPPPLDPLDAVLAEHGRLTEARKVEVLCEGLAEVIRPAAEALLGRALPHR